jgi:hypothetical protein
MDALDAELQVPDRCFRCDYDLRGIADEQPCPECGLLAERSRRKTEHLADAPPGWLRRVAIGLWLILISFLAAGAWPILMGVIINIRTVTRAWPVVSTSNVFYGGFLIAAVLFLIGNHLFTAAESAISLDDTDQHRRRKLRRMAWLPLLALIVLVAREWVPYRTFRGRYNAFSTVNFDSTHDLQMALTGLMLVAAVPIALLLPRRWPGGWRIGAIGIWIAAAIAILTTSFHESARGGEMVYVQSNFGRFQSTNSSAAFFIAMMSECAAWMAVALVTLGCAMLPWLIFSHLRALSRRVLAARIAEYCTIVGVGFGLTLVSIPLLLLLHQFGNQFIDYGWNARSDLSLALTLTVMVSFFLFAMWMIVTLLAGALAFARAARDRRQRWQLADRSDAI